MQLTSENGRGPESGLRQKPPEGSTLKVALALIADEANLSQEGKLNVMGAFDRIAASNFPTVHPKMVFVFRIDAGFGDGGGPVDVRVRLMDEDGGTLFDAGGELQAPEVQPGEMASAYQMFNLVGIRFPKPGTYKFVVNLGEDLPHETPLFVMGNGWRRTEGSFDA